MPSPPAGTTEAASNASVWVLLGHKAGDNEQVLALAESLGTGFERRELRYRATELASNVLLGPNLLGVQARHRVGLEPPWPRLVISSGRRNEPVARWIRRQADHPVRLVHVGRPWADPAEFDLIVSTPQYLLGNRPNVVELGLPLQRHPPSADDAACAAWADRLAALPRPWIAVLVGGESGMFQLDPDKADRLARQSDELADRLGGSLLVTTSRRTPPGIAARLDAALQSPHFVYEWQPDAADNPYRAWLALADRLIVTGESMSMLAEACATRRPVYVFDMHDSGPMSAAARLRWLKDALRYRAWTHRAAQVLAPERLRRDVSRLHAALMAEGRAVWLGDEFPEREPPPLPGHEAVAARVRALLDPDPGDRNNA